MKRLLALVATAGAAVGLYAATATGGSEAVTPAQFTALQKKVTKLQKDVGALTVVANFTLACGFDRGAIPVSKSPQFHITGTGGAGEAADFYVLTTSRQECVQAINSPALKTLRAGLGR